MFLDYKNDILLENERVRLEPLGTKHIDLLSSIVVNDPNIFRFFNAKLGTHQLLIEYIEKHIKLRQQNLKYAFAIYDKQKKTYAGSTSFLNISEMNKRLEIGSTWIGKMFQKTGLNRNCKFLLLEYAFEQLHCDRVELKTDGRNLNSQNAIKGIGATYEGCLRSHTVMPDGFRRDTMYYSILKNEWETIKSTLL